MLEKFGFSVLCGKDGQEGVEIFRKNSKKINAILLDMTMPKMSGEVALREFLRINPEIRVILSSGFLEQDAIARFSGMKLAGFIQKPYQPAVLIKKFHEVLHTQS